MTDLKAPTYALCPIILDNACILYFIATIGTQLVDAYSSDCFFSKKRSLRPMGLLPPCVIAPLGFRPLWKIPHRCLSQEFGPCFSLSVVDHPLRPAIDRCLGKPLPHQLANQTQAPPWAYSSFCSLAYGVLAIISSCYPLLKCKFLRITHMSAIENTTRMFHV